MLQKSKGFSMLELLISLNIICFLTLSILPELILIEKHRFNLKLTNTANKLIQQELKFYIYDHGFKSADRKNVDMTNYYIVWEAINEKMVKVCVSWEDNLGQSQEKCGYGKR